MDRRKEDQYVFYCNQAYKKSDLNLKKRCNFCESVIRCSVADNYMPNCTKINIRFDEYIKEYYLCEKCGKKVIDAIEEVKNV